MIGRTERDASRGGRTRRYVRPILRLVAGAAGGAVVLLSLASPASAHHCGSLSDCFDSGRALLLALAALLIVVGIIAIFFGGGAALPALAFAGGGGVTASAGAISVAAVGKAAVATGAALTTGILLAEAANNSPTGSSSGGSSRPGVPQRAPAEKPWVSDHKLRNIIDNLFKNTSKPDRVGNGTTMDAVRNEILTGRSTAGKWHTAKLKQTAGDLVKWLQRNPSASAHDKQVVHDLLKSINNALKTTAG